MNALFGNDFPCCTTTPEDTAVIDADTPTDPLPAEGAPHAYVVVRRTHSAWADRPEWAGGAFIVPAHQADEIEHWRKQGYTLIGIAPDGDAGTRAVFDPSVEQLRRLLADLTDPDDCDFDHHGGCQAHGYLTLEPGELCPHAEAKQLLAEGGE